MQILLVLWLKVSDEAARCFGAKERNSTNTCTQASLSFLLTRREPKSSNDKLSLLISIVAYVGQPLSKQLYMYAKHTGEGTPS